MSRPGFALEVDERTPPLLVRSSSAVRLERFSLGTQVLYPPDGQAYLDVAAQVDHALDTPVAGEPLAARLRPGMRLTITFTDVSVPTPGAADDPRRVLIERVLELAAAAGVDDVALIAETGLRRRLDAQDFERLLGERISRSFAAGGLTSHDAEARDDLVAIGDIDGRRVELNRRVVESDLVVHVGVATEMEASGWHAVAAGLGSADTVDLLNGWQANPRPVCELVASKIDVWSLTCALGQPTATGALRFLTKREWEWNLGDQAAYLGVRRLLATAPVQASHVLYNGRTATYPVLAVRGGPVDEVARAIDVVLADSTTVTVKGSTDVLVAGVPTPVAAAPDGDGTPLADAWHVLTRAVPAASQTLLREGGAVIGFSRLGGRFSSRHHSAAADFTADVLPVAAGVDDIATNYQPRFAADPWYTELYRERGAFHPLWAFHLWYAMQPGIAHAGDVVFVGADRRSAEVMGFRAASTYPDALEIVSTKLGRRPAITYVRTGTQLRVVAS